jgi:RHS repeat-associated protein
MVSAPQSVVDAVFRVLVADLAAAPRELVDPDSGSVTGRVCQSLYGRRVWRGADSCPLLFAGQYADGESGWVYNRFRFYDPVAGVYGAQDPLGVAPRIAGAQGYVDHAHTHVDMFRLKSCEQEF